VRTEPNSATAACPPVFFAFDGHWQIRLRRTSGTLAQSRAGLRDAGRYSNRVFKQNRVV